MKIQKILTNNKIENQSTQTKKIKYGPNNCGDSFTFTGSSMKDKTNRINEMEEYINSSSKDANFRFPPEYAEMADSRIKDIGNWTLFFDKKFTETSMEGLKNRYGITNLVPFANKQDSVDLACFCIDGENKNKIITINSFFPGRPRILSTDDNFNFWLKRISENAN